MLAEPAVASVHKPVAAPAYHPRSSLLIRVHLRLPFLVPEQARNRRKAAMSILDETLQAGGEGSNRITSNRSHGLPWSPSMITPPHFGCGRQAALRTLC